MHAFDVLGDPVRRRILELLAEGERSSGEIVEVVQREFGIRQPAVSQHLRALRVSGFATVRVDGARRISAVDAAPLKEVDAWVSRFRGFWEHKLDALATEIARGKRFFHARCSPTRTIFIVLVPPDLPIGSPIVSTTRSPSRTSPFETRRASAASSTASRSVLCSRKSVCTPR